MHSVLRPNYRRARALALEIEAASFERVFLSDGGKIHLTNREGGEG